MYCELCSRTLPAEDFCETYEGGASIRRFCNSCRGKYVNPTVQKISIDCFNCGAVVFVELPNKYSLDAIRAGSLKITQVEGGHYVIFKAGFVLASCLPMERYEIMMGQVKKYMAECHVVP